MGLFSRFENKMEDTVEGAADKMSNAPINPVQIAKKAEKQMRREKMVGAGKEYAPTLYTVLVNPEDDKRLFGYYPTLAGETETYLSAKAQEEGLVMDGQPLVRFVVDDTLHHGKFDIIAEAVSASIIQQLRAEEMTRYGIGQQQMVEAARQIETTPAPQFEAAPAQQFPPAQQPYPQQQPQQFGQPYPQPYAQQPQQAYAQPQPQQQPFPQPYPQAQQADAYAYADPYGANQPQSYGYDGYRQQQPQPQQQPAQPQEKPPLPYVPENEIDYSVDYGQYTFDSSDFEDYRDQPSEAELQARELRAQRMQQQQHRNSQQVGRSVPAQIPDIPAPAAQAAPQVQPAQQAVPGATIAYTPGAAAQNQPPQSGHVQARLVDTAYQRVYDLAGTLVTIGRESGNDIVVQDINASRKHAELRLTPQGLWTITDLHSTNGTVVNGTPVTSQPLRPGDIVTIGKTDFEFTLR
jgi:pSer/pThr/pTyr-binding forkhead associated (FHA) protein